MIKLNPSSLQRVALCPGSVAAEAGLPWQPSDQAAEGTLLHEAVRTKQTANLKPSQVRDVETCWRIGKQLLEQVLGARPGRFLFEEYVRSYVGDSGELSAKLDFIALADADALVIDWKFGRADEVDASENLQLRAYALIAHQEYKAERVTCAIVQPRAERERQKTLVEYSADDLLLAREEIAGIMNRVHGGERVPGPEQCKYCKAAGTDRCPESQQALVHLKMEGQIPFPAGAALGQLIAKARAAESVAKAIQDYARKVLSEGGEIPGWTLKPNPPRAQVTDPQRAFQLLSDRMGAEDFTRACNVTLGTLEEVYREKTGCTAKDAREQVRSLLAGVIETKDIAPSLSRAPMPELILEGAQPR